MTRLCMITALVSAVSAVVAYVTFTTVSADQQKDAIIVVPRQLINCLRHHYDEQRWAVIPDAVRHATELLEN